jgi:isoleucyl-tRNA synthetase
VGALEGRSAAATLRGGGRVGVAIDGHEHALSADDVQLVLKPREGYQLERAGGHAVALDLELDDELRREGLAREVVHAVQAARKNAGLAVEDRIELSLAGDDDLLDAVRAHESYVSTETLATTLAYDGDAPAGAHSASIDGRTIGIGLARIEA